jgi:phosphomannomutase
METLSGAEPRELAGVPVKRRVLLETNDGVKFFRDDSSWLLVRLSGTEPLVRVYAETRSEGDLQPLIDEGARMVGAPH